MNVILQYAKLLAASTYHGIRQWWLQFILLFFFVQVGLPGVDQRYFWALGGEIIGLSLFLYTILYFWFNDFTPRLHALLRIIVPYILCALIIYLRVESERNGGWDVGKTSLYDIMFLDKYLSVGLLVPLYSLMIIGVEHTLKALIPDKAKRIISVCYNVLTILWIVFLVFVLIMCHG